MERVANMTTTQFDRINCLVNELVKINPRALEKSLMQLSLLERAKKLDKSINEKATKMTMAEIVKEVRDYRNEKKNSL